MYRKIAILAMSFLAVAVGASAPKEWVLRYESLLTTLRNRDITAFEALFDPSFVVVDPQGKRATREMFFKDVEGLFGGADKVDAKVKLQSAKVKGNMAWIKFDANMTIYRKPAAVCTIREVGTDTWKKIGGKWMLVKTVDRVFTMKQKKQK